MATGWAPEGAVQDQIDASIKDALDRARAAAPKGESLLHCEDCGAAIPEGRRRAVPGVRLCVNCQASSESGGGERGAGLFNRRGSKDSQLR